MNYREQALDNLVSRLVNGKTIERASSRDIFHDLADDISSAEYQTLLDIIDGVLALNHKFGDAHTLACRALEEKANGLIQSYIASREDWLQEEEARLRAEEPEPELEVG